MYGKPQKDFYSILGVASTATQAEIKKAYFRLALKYHPDKNRGSAVEQKIAEEKIKELNNIYEVLRDPQKRANYDNELSKNNAQVIDPAVFAVQQQEQVNQQSQQSNNSTSQPTYYSQPSWQKNSRSEYRKPNPFSFNYARTSSQQQQQKQQPNVSEYRQPLVMSISAMIGLMLYIERRQQFKFIMALKFLRVYSPLVVANNAAFVRPDHNDVVGIRFKVR